MPTSPGSEKGELCMTEVVTVTVGRVTVVTATVGRGRVTVVRVTVVRVTVAVVRVAVMGRTIEGAEGEEGGTPRRGRRRGGTVMCLQ